MVGRLPSDNLKPAEFLEHELALANLELKQIVLKTLLILYALGFIIAIAIIISYSFKLTDMSESFVHWVGGGFLAQIISACTIIVKHFFTNNSNS
jgi:hypothetical protein